MIRRPPRSTLDRSSAASDVYKRQKLGGVTDGSPAAKAGLLAGDIIVQFGEKKISNIYDFTYALGNYVPGDKVNVIIKRGEKEMTVEIELGSR